MTMTITELCKKAYWTAHRHGFHERPIHMTNPDRQTVRHILSLLMLVGTEVAEAAEAVRKGTLDDLGEELADVCIRVFDLAYAAGVDLEHHITLKMGVNERRPYMHGGKRA